MHRADKNEKDVLYILNHLRDEDLCELKTLWGENWKDKTLENIMNTDFQVLLGKTNKGDIPTVMGGIWQVEADTQGVGCAWLLSTDNVKNYKMCLLRELKREMEKADGKFWLTYNFIYEKNYMAKNWLKWLGFKFDNPKPEGVDVPFGFEFFYRIRPDYSSPSSIKKSSS